jgi:hypothetical protein
MGIILKKMIYFKAILIVHKEPIPQRVVHILVHWLRRFGEKSPNNGIQICFVIDEHCRIVKGIAHGIRTR